MPKQIEITGRDTNDAIRPLKLNTNGHPIVDLGSNNDVNVVGNVAHDATDSGNPVKIGVKARNANPTAVANNDRADIFGDLKGRLVVLLNQVRELVTRGNVTIDKETETTVLTQAAGVYHDCVLVQGSNSSTGAFRVDFRDDTGGTVRFSMHLSAGEVSTISFYVPFPATAVNDNWTAQIVDDAGITDLSNAGVSVMLQAVKNT